MASSRKRALSTDERGGEVSSVGRSGEKERPAKVARKRRVTIAAAEIIETDKQGMMMIHPPVLSL